MCVFSQLFSDIALEIVILEFRSSIVETIIDEKSCKQWIRLQMNYSRPIQFFQTTNKNVLHMYTKAGRGLTKFYIMRDQVDT